MIAVKTAVGPTILLRSGHYFDLLDPAGSRFTLGDIAHGLGNACRFAGQCSRFYSVAEHSWHASRIVPEQYRFAALMHDAAEAFIGDVTRPLKALLPEYRVIEKRIEAVIAKRFRLGDMLADAVIKQADLRMLATEQAHMMPPHADTWSTDIGVELAEVNFRRWTPIEAAQHWLDRAGSLLATYPVADLERL